jgi:tellurite resistance protein TerC
MQNIESIWLWIGFCLFVFIALTLDTILFAGRAKGPHTSMKAALSWTLVWVSCAFVFNGILWWYLSVYVDVPTANQKSLDFLTGYLIEESLSIDNLFAFYMIFHQLKIPKIFQRRVLTYGIWSAIFLRLAVILGGVYIVNRFHSVLYVLGVVLLLTGFKMLVFNKEEKNIKQGFLFRWIKDHLRITNELHEHNFFIRKKKLLYATPLFLALILVEISDIIFAFDSIPAIFAITQDPFIIWTSNIFAILGLRSLYFLLVGMADRFRLLKYGIAFILIFVGLKMLIAPWIKISTLFSLGAISGILTASILVSLLTTPKKINL